jgi:hypothetical protein
MKTERIGVVKLTENIRNRLNEKCGEVESLRRALGRIAEYPHTTSGGLESDEMRRIAREALDE